MRNCSERPQTIAADVAVVPGKVKWRNRKSKVVLHIDENAVTQDLTQAVG